MQPELQEFLHWAFKNKGKIIGVLLGLLLGWMTIEYGVFQTFFVVVLIYIGYYLGKRSDRQEGFQDLLDQFISSGKRK
ncbi:MAG: DUF2273 domain-containing protein [Firmicutes bacterium]|nr:DUF2273 domain-containing protein [Bacillota bacterium]